MQVTIEVSRQGAGDFHLRQPAGSAGATNKLLQAARLTLPEAGTYDARILLDGPLGNVSAEFTLDVLEAMPRWFVQWPWLFWPIVPLGLYVWQSVARSRKLGKRMSTSPRMCRSSFERSGRPSSAAVRDGARPVHVSNGTVSAATTTSIRWMQTYTTSSHITDRSAWLSC